MTNVTKEDYWTIILNDPTKIGQVTTLDEEFNRRVNNVNVVLSNTFINSSDENLISKWEASLYIDGTKGKTITERKADILYKLCVKNYVPVSIIKRFLLNLIGDENRFAVEFIKDENKLVIHTDRIEDNMMTEVNELLERVVPQNIKISHYNHSIEISWIDIDPELEPALADKYENCETLEDIIALDSNYKNDKTISGAWSCLVLNLKKRFRNDANDRWETYEPSNWFGNPIEFNSPLPSLEKGIYAFSNTTNLKKFNQALPNLVNGAFMFYNSSLESWNVDLPKCTYIFQMFAGCKKLKSFRAIFSDKASFGAYAGAWINCSSLEVFDCDVSKYELGSGNWTNCSSLRTFNMGTSITQNANNEWSGCSSLTEFNGTFPKLRNGPGMFSKCVLNKISTLSILNSIPAYTSGSHLLTIGIHIDHQNDEEVLAAIANAEAKGWTLTVQWNGTPTSTASTMAMGSLIYVKVGEMERPDGTTEQYLDWGHYVTDETGYEAFRSLESAYKYFNLEQPTEI